MKLRAMKHTKPRPRFYTLSASVKVPEYIGPFNFPMDSVRLTFRRSCQSATADHRVCMRHIIEARDAYVASKATMAAGNTGEGEAR